MALDDLERPLASLFYYMITRTYFGVHYYKKLNETRPIPPAATM